jgi:hypothetical protein
LFCFSGITALLANATHIFLFAWNSKKAFLLSKYLMLSHTLLRVEGRDDQKLGRQQKYLFFCDEQKSGELKQKFCAFGMENEKETDFTIKSKNLLSSFGGRIDLLILMGER